MTATTWTSADLLARFKTQANLPTTSEVVSDATIYDYLTLAQEHCYGLWAQHFPNVLYGAPSLMTTSDGGYTYVFASAAYPMGQVEIRASRSGALLVPCNDWDGGDYVPEGNQIRIPNGKSRTFSAGPYARFMAQPGKISAADEPTLNPPFARILIVYHALYLWANQAGNAAVKSPDHWLGLFQNAWSGDQRVLGDAGVLGVLKGQFYAEGATGYETPWYYSADLG